MRSVGTRAHILFTRPSCRRLTRPLQFQLTDEHYHVSCCARTCRTTPDAPADAAAALSREADATRARVKTHLVEALQVFTGDGGGEEEDGARAARREGEDDAGSGGGGGRDARSTVHA